MLLLFPFCSDDASVVAHSQPTNNLDLEAVVALADAVESFEGGVVVVSTQGGELRGGADNLRYLMVGP